MACLLMTLILCANMIPSFAQTQERAFTDSVGRTVMIPKTVERVAVTGPIAQMMVFALAPDLMVGIATEWDAAAKEVMNPSYSTLPVLGQLYGKGEINLEELLKADPQVIIDVGEPKDSIVEDLDGLTEQLGIPFVHVTSTSATTGDAFLLLGDLLGLPAEAAELAAYSKTVYERTVAIAESVEKVNMLYITGANGLNVIARGSYHSEVIDLLSNNLAVVDSPSGKGSGNEVDIEQIMAWNPDVIIFASQSMYASAADDPLWQEITAIRTGHYWQTPMNPVNWLGFPSSVQRLLSMIWMADTLYPDAAGYELYDEVKEYLARFYHFELTHEQYAAWMEN